jgi:hypothetical protein
LLPDRTETIPAGDWYFHSGEQILEDLQKRLKKAPPSDHAAIKEQYAGYWSEYAKQHQANRKRTSEARKAEAAVAKAARAEQRAIHAIVKYEPSSPREALLVLEFAADEDAIGSADELRMIMENASRALHTTV